MNQQTCNRAWLDAFLNNDLNESEEHWLTSHLDECSDCRDELESRAAEQSVWQEASNMLGGSKLHATAAIGDHRSAIHSPQIALVLQQLAPTDDTDSLGRIGGYEVTGVVGAGGMGVVLKAHDRSLDRIVAVKVMSPHLASSGSARKRFAREAKAAAAVLHPNVIAIHSVASEDANPFLVMPFVRGASLQKRIDSQGPLPLKDTLRIGAQIAAGLAAAHEQGLVHRDIKPANILLEEGVERVTITDFGLARAVDDASMTCSGVIAGTPQYMSPEQARGEPIDARSDLFSLGSVLYAMCTGRSPFRAETTYGVMHRIANEGPTPVCEVNTDVPAWLGQVIERLMAKRAEDRFESAAQVAELLEGCLAHVQQPTAIPLPEAVTALAPKKTRRPPIGKFIVATAFAFAIIFAGVLIMLELDKGTLTIESEMQDVPIRILHGDKIVERLTVSQSGNSVRVSAGNYVVELDTKLDGIVVENDRVSLKRGTTEHVMIRLSKQAANPAVGVHNQSAMENTGSADILPPSATKPKIIVILSGGRNVLKQMNTSRKNKHIKLFEELHGISGVEANFRYREGDLSNEFSQAVVRDPAGLMIEEALATGKPSARRDAIAKALAQIPIVEWEDVVDSSNVSATIPLTRYSIEANTTGYGHAPQVGSRIDLLVNIHVPDPTDPEVRPVVRNALVTATHDSRENLTVSREVTIELQLSDAEIQLVRSYEPLHAFTFRPVDQKTSLKTKATGGGAEPNASQSAKQPTEQVIDALVTFEFSGVVGNARLSTTGIGWVIDQRGHILVPDEVAPRSDDYKIEVRYADGSRTSAKRVFTFGHLALLKPEKAPAIAPIQLRSVRSVQDNDQVLAILNGTDVQNGTVTSARKTIVSSDSWPIRYAPPLRFPNAIETDFKSDAATLFGAPLLTPSGEVVGMLLNYANPLFAIPLSEIQIACREFESSQNQSPENAVEATHGTTNERSTADEKAKIIVDVYGGNRVLGQNNSKYAKMVQALSAIDDVQVNFREAGSGSDIVLAIVRDHTGIMGQEANSNGKPSARRDAIAKALTQVPTVRWEEGALGVSLQSNQNQSEQLFPGIFDQSQSPRIDNRNARSVVEAYVAAALAGEVAKAAALAKNSPADQKQIAEIPEFLNVQRLKIQTVYINDPVKPTQAVATSVAVKLGEEHKNPDGRRDGFMVFTLEFTDDKWFVIDIDFETESGAEKELNNFLKANPSSIGIPPQSQGLSR